MADINLDPTTVTGHPTAQPSDSDLLAALQAAHAAGDTKAAMEIAQLLSAGPVTHEAQPANSSGSPHADSGGGYDPLQAYVNSITGPAETAAHVVSGGLAAPVAGYAGLGAEALHALGANVDPANVVRKTQTALTYQPHTEGGKDIVGAIDKVGSVIPQGANYVGEHVADATGSPALGAAANTGLQALGMYATGKIPAVAGSAPVTRAGNLISDYLPGGASRASSRLINQYASDTPGGGAAALQNVQAHNDAQTALNAAARSGALANKYGLAPTGTQVAQSPGLAQLDRTIRNQAPDIAAPLNDADLNNRGAVVNILKGIAGTPEQRLRAGAARDFQARTAYDDALNNPDHFVQPPNPTDPTFAAEAAAKQGLTQDGTPPINDPNVPAQGLNPVGERLQEVLQRPAMQTAMQNAKMQAANRGVKLDDRNLIQQLHYAKMDLDGQISAASRSGDSTTMGGLLDTKNTLLGVMDDLSPAYKQARQGFQAASAPLNRMDVGEALRQKYLSALQESSGTGSRPSMLLDALRRDDGDTLAQQATGFNGATLEGTLRPQDMDALQAARDQLGREAYAQNAGRAVGSNTGQNLANQTAIDSVGDVSSPAGHLGALGMAIHHPLVAIPLGLRGAGVRQAAQRQVGQTLADPAALAQTLRQKYAVSNGPPLQAPVAVPTVVGATEASDPGHATGGKVKVTMDEWKAGKLHSGSKHGPVVTDQKQAIAIALNQQRKGHADGGPVDVHGNPIHAPTFWELVQTAVHELTTPDDPKPTDVPLGQGMLQQDSNAIQSNPNRMMNVADAQS